MNVCENVGSWAVVTHAFALGTQEAEGSLENVCARLCMCVNGGQRKTKGRGSFSLPFGFWSSKPDHQAWGQMPLTGKPS